MRRAAKGRRGRAGDVRDGGKGLRRGGVQGRQERRDKERTDEMAGAGEKEITAGSDRVVEINVARLIGATEECACGLSGSQLARYVARTSYVSLGRMMMPGATFDIQLYARLRNKLRVIVLLR